MIRICLLKLKRQTVALTVDVSPRSETDEGEAPDDDAAWVEEGVGRLIWSAEAASEGPEKKDRSAPEVFFRNKTKVSAISAVGMVIS